MSTNLSLLARSYLMIRPSKREFEKRSLIANIPQSIPHLLQESIQICKEFNPLPRLRNVPANQIGGQAPRYLWSLYVVDPCVRDIFDIVNSQGNSGIDALIRGLYENDPATKVMSTLVLLEIEKPNSRLVEQLSRATDHIRLSDSDKPYYKESLLFIVLLFILYKGGFKPSRAFIENLIKEEKKSFSESLLLTRNTMMNFLFEETGQR